MATAPGTVDCQIVFRTPHQTDTRWEQSDIVRTARAISAVTVVLDRDGVETRRFAAATSGQVLFYDRAGRLVFDGGITGSRGHLGENSGARALTALMNRQPVVVSHTPVFGCPLFKADATCREGVPCSR